MKDDTLGKKIKALRLEKGMTQAALSGETITRNMLSQIENGVAQPSVGTIMELAEKLGTPPEYFFSENGTLDDFKKLGAIARIRKYYAAGDHARVMARLDALRVSDDETEFLYAKSSFARGVAAYRAGMLRSAASFLEAAILHASRSVYVDHELSAAAGEYLEIISYVASKGSGGMPERGGGAGARLAEAGEDILYIYAVSGRAELPSVGCMSSPYREHLHLRERLSGAGDDEKHALLEALLLLLEKAGEERYAVLRYYIYEDLEELAKGCGDYKCAYECSSGRLALAEKMNG